MRAKPSMRMSRRMKRTCSNGSSAEAKAKLDLRTNPDATIQFDAPEPPGPTERRYVTNDTSYEKLGEILAENPNGILATVTSSCRCLRRSIGRSLPRRAGSPGAIGRKAARRRSWRARSKTPSSVSACRSAR